MGQNKYVHQPHQPKQFELVCPNDGLSYFDTEYDNCFFVRCHLCEWQEPNPEYQSVIPDEEIMRICDDRSDEFADCPEVVLSGKYLCGAINSKLEELDHRGLLIVGGSLRTAWLSKEGERVLDEILAK